LNPSYKTANFGPEIAIFSHFLTTIICLTPHKTANFDILQNKINAFSENYTKVHAKIYEIRQKLTDLAKKARAHEHSLHFEQSAIYILTEETHHSKTVQATICLHIVLFIDC